MPVGEVTLISVRLPSITSMPTNSNPRWRSAGPSASQISRSRGAQFGGLRRAAAHHVGAQIISGRNAIDGAGKLAVDQDDALVAMLDLGQEALDHPGLLEGHREHVVERAEIHVLRHHPKHRRAAMAVQRLHHHGAVLVAEGVDLVEIARDQGRRHQLRKIHHEQLFRRIADAGGIVHHQRLGMDALEDMRRGDVGEIERRILPQQHDIE